MESWHWILAIGLTFVAYVASFFFAGPAAGSAAFNFTRNDAWRVLRGGLVVAASAAVTAALQYLDTLPSSPIALVIIPFISIVLNTIQKWLTDTRTNQ